VRPLLLTEGAATATTHAQYAPQSSNWPAELELWFEARDGKTRLMRRRHLGPLMVQRPFHPESDGTCHVYLLHPPGGVAGGDQLDMRFHLGPGAGAVLTTPGATKFYRSLHAKSEQRAVIDVGVDAVCEYLPQETIVFDGADADIDTCVTLADGATYVGWDFICLGRPAAGERFESGMLSQRTKIMRVGKPVWFERLHIPGGSPLCSAPYALAGKPIFGTMVYVGQLAENVMGRVRSAVGSGSDGVFSVSQLEHVVVCRYLGPKVSEGKALFARAWDALRTACQGKPASAPRIWAT
jgi:urease accessory protein